MLRIWRPMSSADLNNEDHSSDKPRRFSSFDELFGAEPYVTPDRFFRELKLRSPGGDFSREDYKRAVFLFLRLQSARRIVFGLILLLMIVSSVPFFCLSLSEELRTEVFVGGISMEVVAGVGLFFAQSRWLARRRDYSHWLRVVHRRTSEI